MYNFKTLAGVTEKEGRIKGSKAWCYKAKKGIADFCPLEKLHVYEMEKHSETSDKTQFVSSGISIFIWIKLFLHLRVGKRI